MPVRLLNICRIKLSIASNNFRVTVTVPANNSISAVTTHTHITTSTLRAFKPILFISSEKECQGHILFHSFCEIISVEIRGNISKMPNPARIPHVLRVPFPAVLTQSR